MPTRSSSCGARDASATSRRRPSAGKSSLRSSASRHFRDRAHHIYMANRVQLAWPFAVLGAAAGSQLPAGLVGGVTLALVLGFLGALISTAIDRVRDWQVALMAPIVGAGTGAIMGFILDGSDAGALGMVAGTGFGLLALPPLVLIAEVARRASHSSPRSLLGRAERRR